jgi:hypothetical protein
MAVLLLGLAGYSVYRPAGNADIVDYVSTAHSWQGLSGQALSDAVYGDLRGFLTSAQYDDVTGAGDKALGRNVYLHAMATDPVSLAQQIPFYAVKPLYPGLMLALHAVGVPLPLSTVLISAAAFIALGLLLFAWLRRHHGPWLALLFAGLLCVSPPFAVLASLSTPDALGLLLVTGAAFAMVELRRFRMAVVLLVLAVLTRPNAVVFAVALLGAGVVAAPSSGIRIRPVVGVVVAAGLAAVVLGVSRLVGGYAYTLLFSHTFYGWISYPANGAPPLRLGEVLHLYAFLVAQLPSTLLPLFLLLAAVGLRLRGGRIGELRNDGPALLVVAAVLAAIAGWLAFPSEPDRMLVGSYLAITVVLAASAARRAVLVPIARTTDLTAAA